ncbi:SA1362 family protein [Bacillus sp. DTU_2020_1000418_1_SI_GHA_SEK_038]|nr:SA1362 family protein [Bacillus sp. DTU_2020_1000418_1_SI_GHA_SEK_038]WNS74195.1 SA1362 family protein [Bacillus sp. DTU_2020_1000418_1_SI_GHA_SEK_038]
MAFLKNRISLLVISGLILLAVLGVSTSLIANPAGFLRRIAVILLVGAIVFYIFQRFYRASPKKQEQRAFIRAAKKSKRRFHQPDAGKGNSRKASSGSLTSIKRTRKKSSTHLTVIEGKKGKKKDRASL